MNFSRDQKYGLYDPSYEHDACGIGFIADIKGIKSPDIVIRGLAILERMAHRGAEGADEKTGDGAGIMIQVPHKYYSGEVKSLPEAGEYGTGLVFLPRDNLEASVCMSELETVAEEEGLSVLYWRDVKTNSRVIGEIAAVSEPVIRQVFFISKQGTTPDLELKLFITRKIIEKRMRDSSISGKDYFHIPSLSSKTIVYKGMFTPEQLKEYYHDLGSGMMESAMALVHSRFSTNTFPSWDLAQPFRMMAHNGEINTVRGNRFWMHARESDMKSDILGNDLDKTLPVVEPGKSDSASFDNVLEMLVRTGRSMQQAIMMMVPESWNDKNPIDRELKYFYEYNSTSMEPWDGPASMVFCDGRYIGGTLDRNGLRPSRYVVTTSGLVVMASESGVQTFPPEEIELKGRLMPGKLLLVDTLEGRIIPDEEVKKKVALVKPYGKWVEENRIELNKIHEPRGVSHEMNADILHRLQVVFGYNTEDINDIILPMVMTSQEPVGSMGTDTPLAVFSDKPQPLFNYFKQIFAQVTNPAIDSIREELVMSLTGYIGPRRNILDETPEHCRLIKYYTPVFTNIELEKIRSIKNPHFRTKTIDALFRAEKNSGILDESLDRICHEAEKAVDSGYNMLILSDRKTDSRNAPIPSLLACSAIHHCLIAKKKRTRTGIIIETGEAREVMHFALLIGYGADAVNPYLVFATIDKLVNEKRTGTGDFKECETNYIKSINKGLLKILAKMGISTLRSYRGAQIFEAVGLSKDFIDKYFNGTASKISGIGADQIALESIKKHEKAFLEKISIPESEGVYHYRRDGEKHAWNPEAIYMLQWAVRTGDYGKYKNFSGFVDDQNRRPHCIRGLFDFCSSTPIPLDDVEPVNNILKRLTTGAMSFGSISKEAHEAIAIAMNSIQGRSNSGEGGEDPQRFIKMTDGTSSRSAIKQVASARFGVTSNYLANADEIQIKISQGAKPGEGGQLPGHKVDGLIARTRHSISGVTLISPPPHHDIYSIEDLAQLIFDLKNANPLARISVKLVSESGVGTVATGVAKAHADNILISGYDGGTGASPISSIKHAGLPWEIGLAETHQTLLMNDLRGRVRLQTDGQLKTGRDVVLAGILGAEEFGFGTAVLIALGCVMMRKCHLNTCPVGITTQDPELRRRFAGKSEHIVNYFTFMANEIREIMAGLGIRRFDELIGRTELLKIRDIGKSKAGSVDPSLLLYRHNETSGFARHCVRNQHHRIDDVLDKKLIELSASGISSGGAEKVNISLPVRNTDRAVGAMLSWEISKKYGESGLPDGSITCTFSGSAGQSFGSFLAKGVTFRLEGDANDYYGKGLSGGRLIAVPPAGTQFKAEDNIIVGNTVLYGATSGEAYIRGIAGERFCVRNSGAVAVVEGAGDHCAEYMTGGRIIVLGQVGRNFAAGMSGGIAYVLDMAGNFDYFCNKGMVEVSRLRDFDDQEFIIETLKKHIDYTDSTLARDILLRWYEYLPKFAMVLPFEYKRALNEMKIALIDERLKAIREDQQIQESY